MKEQLVAATVLAATACGCESNSTKTSEHDEIPIACVLTALTRDQREREGVLLQEHLASVREVKEREDGYSFRYDPDMSLFARMAELVTLEHRCCPFLNFELEWAGANANPWLHIRGGARVKEFVVETFAPKRS